MIMHGTCAIKPQYLSLVVKLKHAKYLPGRGEVIPPVPVLRANCCISEQ